jgi:drug/metabolite transporter (DMT)-like permease
MWQGVLCGLLAGAMWGLVFVAPAFLTAFTPLELACGRYIAYGLISAGLLFNRLPALLRRLDRADMLALLKHALAGNIVYYMLLAMGVKLAGVAATSLIIGVLPISVTLLGNKDHGSVPLRQLALPLLLVAAGIGCINSKCSRSRRQLPVRWPTKSSACCAQRVRCCAGPGIRSTTRAI